MNRWALSVALIAVLSFGLAPARRAGAQTATPTPVPASAWFDRTEKVLRDLSRQAEEWGTISMSSPLLALSQDSKKVFEFDLPDLGPANYYTDARADVAGTMGYYQQSSLAVAASLSAQMSATGAAAFQEALRQYKQGQADQDLGRAEEAERKAYRKAATLLEAQKYLDDLGPNATAAERNVAEAARLRYLADHDPLVTPTPAPYPTPAGDLPELDSGREGLDAAAATRAFHDDKMKGYGELISGATPPKVPNRVALSTAAGDTATEAIFRVLGSPQLAGDYEDKVVLFGVAMVSVTPGWRTRHNYAADVTITPEYEWVPSRGDTVAAVLDAQMRRKEDDRDPTLVSLLELVDRPADTRRPDSETPQKGRSSASAVGSKSILHAPTELAVLPRYQVPAAARPLVTAATPMMDAEVLDKSASVRSQQSYALAIAAALADAGMKKQGKLFVDWAQRTEADAQARTSFAAVSMFNLSGGQFGFQVGPRLDPGYAPRKGGVKDVLSASTLERQAFPVLLIVGLDRSDIGVRFAMRDGAVQAYEPALKLHQEIRWVRLERGSFPFYRRSHHEERKLELARQVESVLRSSPLTIEKIDEALGHVGEAENLRDGAPLTCANATAVGSAMELWRLLGEHEGLRDVSSQTAVVFAHLERVWEQMKRANCQADYSTQWADLKKGLERKVAALKAKKPDASAGGDQVADPCKNLPETSAIDVALDRGPELELCSTQQATLDQLARCSELGPIVEALAAVRRTARSSGTFSVPSATRGLSGWITSARGVLTNQRREVLGPSNAGTSDPFVREAVSRLETLSSRVLGSWSYQDIPQSILLPPQATPTPDAEPTFTGVPSEAKLVAGFGGVVKIDGAGLKKLAENKLAVALTQVWAGIPNPLPASRPTVMLTKSAVVIEFKPGDIVGLTPGPALLLLSTETDAGTWKTLFRTTVAIEKQKVDDKPGVIISRDASGQITGVALAGGATLDTWGPILKEIFGGGGTSEFEMSVQGEAGITAKGKSGK